MSPALADSLLLSPREALLIFTLTLCLPDSFLYHFFHSLFLFIPGPPIWYHVSSTFRTSLGENLLITNFCFVWFWRVFFFFFVYKSLYFWDWQLFSFIILNIWLLSFVFLVAVEMSTTTLYLWSKSACFLSPPYFPIIFFFFELCSLV